MTNGMKRNRRGGRGPRTVLYALGVLVAIMAAVLVKTTAVDNSGLSSVNLTSFNPLTVAPIPDQSSDTGTPIIPIAPTAADSQVSPFPIIAWSAVDLPPGITISRSSGLIQGTPSLAGTYQVTISAKDNAHPPTYGSTSFTWDVGNMAPRIVQVVPIISQGAGGIRVIITGKNFLDATAVHFGSVPAGGITVNRNGTKIVAFAPPQEAGTVDVTVTAIGGTSSPTPTDQFTYIAPNITYVAQDVGSTGGGTRVKIAGTGLAGATSVDFGGVESSDFSVGHDGTALTAVAPAGSVGTVQITVVTPGGTAVTSGRDDFTYDVPVVVVHHRRH